jgi:hypothetical protein
MLAVSYSSVPRLLLLWRWGVVLRGRVQDIGEKDRVAHYYVVALLLLVRLHLFYSVFLKRRLGYDGLLHRHSLLVDAVDCDEDHQHDDHSSSYDPNQH